MAHKRPREGDGEDRVADDSEGEGGALGIRLLSLFGRNAIHEIEEGNTIFARGGFGELAIALKRGNSPSPSSSPSSSLEIGGGTSYSLVAVKTIHNAIPHGGGSGSIRFGGFGGQPQQQQQKQQQISGEVLNELLALRLLQPHPNIVPLVAAYPFGDLGALSLAFEYCPVDLREVLEVRRRTFRQPLEFRFIRTIFRDVFEALAHCHDNGILHRDLKPGNLLVSSRGKIRLCDFGLAKPFLCFDKDQNDGSSNSESIQGTKKPHSAVNIDKGLCTLHYRPPEVLLGGPSEYPSVDSWSAGVVLAELITGQPLWPGRNVIDQLSLVFASLGSPNEDTWPGVRKLPDYGKLNFGFKPPKPWGDRLARATESPMLIDLVSKILALNQEDRLTAREALEHGWLRMHATEKPSVVAASECYRELRDELIMPTSLQIPTFLFPQNRALVEKAGLGIAESRRNLLSWSKGQGIRWQGPIATPFEFIE